MPQAQTGHSPALKSIPKICRINGDDNRMIVYRNLGNNHAYPFIWGDKFTVVSGEQEVVLASGIKFHGYDLASYGNVTASPLQKIADGESCACWWVDKDTYTNIVKIVTSTAAPEGGFVFDVKFMLGADADVERLYCRGTGKGMPSFP